MILTIKNTKIQSTNALKYMIQFNSSEYGILPYLTILNANIYFLKVHNIIQVGKS